MQERRAEGAEGAVGGTEGSPGRPLDVQASLNELLGMLQRMMDFLPSPRRDSDDNSTNFTDDELSP